MRSEPARTDGPQTYRFGPGTRVTQVPPSVCKNGHELGPRLMTVGFSTPHMTYSCNRCWDEGHPNHTTYLLPPSHEEFMRLWNAWRVDHR